MRLESAPIASVPENLASVDFAIFASRFSNIFKVKIPTAKDVFFLAKNNFCGLYSEINTTKKEKIFDRVCLSGKAEKINDESLVFPLPVSGSNKLVALVTGIDPMVVSRASGDWLQEIIELVIEDFIAIKQARIDSVSALYNGTLLKEILTGADRSWNCHVVLVELFPYTRLPKDVFGHIKCVKRALLEFNSYGFPLFHLGQAVFALIIPEKDRGFLKSYCLSLITFIKNKGFKRIHCGSSSVNIKRESDKKPENAGLLALDESWSALHTACRRGPFAFCDFDLLINPDNFPLQPFSQSTISKLQRRWKNNPEYSLVFFKPDYLDQSHLADVVVRYFSKHDFVVGDEGFFVIRKGVSADNSRKWAADIITKLITENDSSFSLSAGVSEYPFKEASKTEIIRNCRKALLHGKFLGYGSSVVFDEISLNISGDIYYNEGDLAGAVREYRRGLNLSPKNVNLLNSLGVAYALMNRKTKAQDAFQHVLEIDSSNFMALYNKGLGEQLDKRYQEAFKSYCRAKDAYNEEGPEKDSYSDLIYQLGVVCFHVQKYTRCIDFLWSWYQDKGDKKETGKCCRYIGLSHYYLNNQTDATTWLQRALTFDEYDAECFSILGELYFQGNEGDNIALSLLEKSVEIESDNILYILRFARGLNLCKDYDNAIPLLRRCARHKKTKFEAWYELSVAYAGMKNYGKVRYYLKRIVDGQGVPGALSQKTHNLLRMY